jgi:hypothetical protein
MKAVVDKWTCDRCGHVVDKPQGSRPVRWMRVATNRQHIEGAFDAEGWTHEHWCGNCASSFDYMRRNVVTAAVTS